MSKDDVLNFLYTKTCNRKNGDLAPLFEVLKELKNPQDKCKCIHVAGTNGKGSASCMLASVLKCAGYKTGLFTSPHLIDPKERFMINGKMISDNDFIKVGEKVIGAANRLNIELGTFDKLCAMAFVYFSSKKCDLVVLEVGLGGRYDATNVISDSLVSVIMNIGLDHIEILGDTKQKIAYEKAGIIKPKGDVVIYDNTKSILKVFEKEAKSKAAVIHTSNFDEIKIKKMDQSGSLFDYKKYKNIKLSLIGKYQFYNAAVVLETLDVLKSKGYKIGYNELKKGLKEALWPARLSIVHKNPLFIIDGAHNPQCCNALKASLKALFPKKKFIFLCGMLQDKDYVKVMDIMAPLMKKTICLTPNSYRALQADELVKLLQKKNKNAVKASSVKEGIQKAFECANKEDIIVSFGSLYLAGEIQEVLN